MSQKTSAPRRASLTTTVPPRAQSQPVLRGGGDPPIANRPQQSNNVPSTDGERPHLFIARPSGVQTLLNPEDSRSSTVTAPILPYGPPRPVQIEHTHTQLPNVQYGFSTPASGPFQFQGLSTEALTRSPRQIVTPRSPRAVSLTHGAPFRAFGSQLSPVPSASTLGGHRRVSSVTGAGQQDAPLTPSQPQIAYLTGAASSASTLPTITATQRARSQSLSRSELAGFVSTTLGGSAQIQHSPGPGPLRHLVLPSEPRYTAGLSPVNHEPLPTSFGAPPQGASLFQSLPTTDGDMGILALPEGDVPMPINRHVASRQADERRHRAAQASSRHRARKKEQQAAKDATLETLQTENAAMERRIDELESDNDRIRADRDRLRSLVLQNPAISDLAYVGPGSPSSARSGGSSSEANTASTGLPPPPPPAAAYIIGATGVTERERPAAQPSLYGSTEYGSRGRDRPPLVDERPSRRRRTDPQFTPLTFPSGHPSPLRGPLSLTYQTSLSQPGTPSAANRYLPPLRTDEASTQPPASAPVSARTPTFGAVLSPYRRDSPGWATRPRGPPPPPSAPH